VLTERWRRHYNTVRPHSALGYRPPAPEVLMQRMPVPLPHPRPTGSAQPSSATLHPIFAWTTRWGLAGRLQSIGTSLSEHLNRIFVIRSLSLLRTVRKQRFSVVALCVPGLDLVPQFAPDNMDVTLR